MQTWRPPHPPPYLTILLLQLQNSRGYWGTNFVVMFQVECAPYPPNWSSTCIVRAYSLWLLT